MEVREVRAVMKAGRRPRVCAVSRLLASITFITSTAFATDKPFAAPQVPEHPVATTAGSLLQVTVSLALVLAAVFAAAWVVRRLRGFGKFGANLIQVVADAPLGTKERAVLVQVGEQQLLLGVAPGRVNLLHVLSQPLRSGSLPDPSSVAGGGNTDIDVSSPSFPPPVAGGGQGGGRVDFAAILRRSLGLK